MIAHPDQYRFVHLGVSFNSLVTSHRGIGELANWESGNTDCNTDQTDSIWRSNSRGCKNMTLKIIVLLICNDDMEGGSMWAVF